MKTKWIPITKDNIRDLRPGHRVRFHDGYEWGEGELNAFWIKLGRIATGQHNETAAFLNPMFGKVVYCNFGKE